MKAFVVLALFLAVASARTLRGPSVQTVLHAQQSKLGGKIIGGTPATLGQFPWQSSVHMDSSYLCGGSIISSNYVLTAAHCVDGFTSFQLAVGTLDWQDISYTATVSAFHPDWNPSIISNDVGYVMVSTPITLGGNVAVVALPHSETGNQFVGTPVTVSGWGRTSNGGSISQTLNWVELTTISNEDCAITYPGIIQDGTICTEQQPGQSTCNGDSGGPLIRTSDEILVGVVSFVSSLGCDAREHGFARVTYFLQWILDNTDAQ